MLAKSIVTECPALTERALALPSDRGLSSAQAGLSSMAALPTEVLSPRVQQIDSGCHVAAVLLSTCSAAAYPDIVISAWGSALCIKHQTTPTDETLSLPRVAPVCCSAQQYQRKDKTQMMVAP